MLYNDEIHSYEDVTGTLRKVLGIDDKKALEFAAIVDKEGRSAIKRGKKADCQLVKEKVEVSSLLPFFLSSIYFDFHFFRREWVALKKIHLKQRSFTILWYLTSIMLKRY